MPIVYACQYRFSMVVAIFKLFCAFFLKRYKNLKMPSQSNSTYYKHYRCISCLPFWRNFMQIEPPQSMRLKEKYKQRKYVHGNLWLKVLMSITYHFRCFMYSESTFITIPLILDAECWSRLRNLHLESCNYLGAYVLFFNQRKISR